MIVIDDRTTDFKMAETISLSPYTDWSIEWRAQLNNASALFGTETSKQNFVYIAYTVSGWGLPFRMVDANNKALMIKQGDYASRNTEMNTLKAEYSSAQTHPEVLQREHPGVGNCRRRHSSRLHLRADSYVRPLRSRNQRMSQRQG